jgi:hypothetical protein
MAATFKTLAFALMLIAIASSADAQNPNAPLGLDLNGVWELEEHGQRLDPALPLVEIGHSGNTVTATFISGSKCADGSDRTIVFIGTLTGQPTTPPIWRMSSDDMWVCSNSPASVKKCGTPAKYHTTFTNATVTPAEIEGKRFRQILDDCSTTTESQASGDFRLRRLQPCELEQRRYDQETEAAHFLLTRIRSQRAILDRGIQAAQDRYQDQFNGQPTSVLTYPVQYMAHDWTDPVELEAFFAAMPDFIEAPEWTAARRMAEDMAGGNNPLPEARAMAVEMRRIEGFDSDARQQLVRLRNARNALDACLRRQQ